MNRQNVMIAMRKSSIDCMRPDTVKLSAHDDTNTHITSQHNQHTVSHISP